MKVKRKDICLFALLFVFASLIIICFIKNEKRGEEICKKYHTKVYKRTFELKNGNVVKQDSTLYCPICEKTVKN